MLRETFAAGFLVSTFAMPCMTTLLIAQHLHPWETPQRNHLAIIGLWSVAGAIVFALTQHPIAIATAALGMGLTFISRRFLSAYYVSGSILLIATVLNLLFGTAWAVNFIVTLSASWMTRGLLLANGALLVFTLPVGLLTLLPLQSYLFRRRWDRPRQPFPAGTLTTFPKVSFHIPCYAEPPDVVCETLNALSRMKYPNFEVLVVDNNTQNPDLWTPLERHCQRLGSRFRFFHVDRLSGAKAGALNFALRHTAESAELIANIDADYIAEPDFLERLVGFFEDPKMGFVQTPHDYRDWSGNLYQRSCYWEYIPCYRLGIAALNEWVASYIIGTMCLIRKQALIDAGGWAEWCLTEDSECSVRIHAAGYESIFLTQTFGRGLIPENFMGYKKQRFRWSVGPIQQLKKHWRLYLPKPFATPSQLTSWQRLFELSHSLQESRALIALIMAPLAFSTLASILYHRERIMIPSVIWISMAALLPAVLGIRWLNFRLVGCVSPWDMLGATLAASSLMHVRFMASLTGWFSLRSPQWQRTNKFKVLPNHLQALKSASVELVLSGLLMLGGVGLASQASFWPPDLLAMIAVGFVMTGISYLAAPLMAVLADHQLRHTVVPTIPQSLSESTLKLPSSSKR